MCRYKCNGWSVNGKTFFFFCEANELSASTVVRYCCCFAGTLKRIGIQFLCFSFLSNDRSPFSRQRDTRHWSSRRRQRSARPDAHQQLEQSATGTEQVQVRLALPPLQAVEMARPAKIRQVGERLAKYDHRHHHHWEEGGNHCSVSNHWLSFSHANAHPTMELREQIRS